MNRPDFLIIGCERSGGHWVSALLNMHPEIACFPTIYFVPGKSRIGELHFFNTIASILEPARQFVRPFSDFSWKFGERYADLVPQRGKVSNEELVNMFVRRYGEICEGERRGKRIVGELSSRYVLFLDWIDRFYPGVKKICIFRDPKDRIVSWYKKKVVQEQGGKEEMVPRDFAIAYARDNVVAEYKALLAYKDPIHCLTYEALHKDPVPAVEGMIEYLGMSHTPDMIAYMIEGGSFEKRTELNDGRARHAGEEAKSFLRKGIVGDFKNAMTEEIARGVDEITRDLEARVFKKYSIIAP